MMKTPVIRLLIIFLTYNEIKKQIKLIFFNISVRYLNKIIQNLRKILQKATINQIQNCVDFRQHAVVLRREGVCMNYIQRVLQKKDHNLQCHCKFKLYREGFLIIILVLIFMCLDVENFLKLILQNQHQLI